MSKINLENVNFDDLAIFHWIVKDILKPPFELRTEDVDIVIQDAKERITDNFKKRLRRIIESKEVERDLKFEGCYPRIPRKTKSENLGNVKRKVSGSARCVSVLEESTIEKDAFGVDEWRKTKEWPGDTWPSSYNQCRQWHGIDISYECVGNKICKESIITSPTSQEVNKFKDKLPKNLEEHQTLDSSNHPLVYLGATNICGFHGHVYPTDRYVTKPKVFENECGDSYVEVKSLLGCRVGAFMPDIKLIGGVSDEFDDFLSSVLYRLTDILLDKTIENLIEECYTGNNSYYPRIYSYIYLRVYTDGSSETGFCQDLPSTGMYGGYVAMGGVDTQDVIDGHGGYSYMPEHYLYCTDVNENKIMYVLNSTDKVKEVIGVEKDFSEEDNYERLIRWLDWTVPWVVDGLGGIFGLKPSLGIYKASQDAIRRWCVSCRCEIENGKEDGDFAKYLLLLDKYDCEHKKDEDCLTDDTPKHDPYGRRLYLKKSSRFSDRKCGLDEIV